MTEPNLDCSFFLVVARACGQPVFYERTLEDASSLPETVLDIFRGQIEDVYYVFEMNPHPSEGWSRNVTETVADNLARLINAEFDESHDRPRPELHAFVEKHSSIRIPAPREMTFQAA